MKRYFYLFIFTLCFFIQPIYAQNNLIQRTIDQELLDESHQVIIDIHFDEFQDITAGEYYQQEIRFMNQCSYDLQLKSISVQSPIEMNNQIVLFFSSKNKKQYLDYDLEHYQDSNSKANQELLQIVQKQRIFSQNDLVFQFEYMLTDEIFLSDVHLIFQFEPIMIQGYVFDDQDLSGIKDQGDNGIENLKMNLWQGDNLLETIKTDQDGYYQFTDYEFSGDCYIEAEELKNYRVSKYIQDDKNANVFKNENGRIICSLLDDKAVTHNYSLGYVAKKYAIYYLANGGHFLFENNQQSYDLGTSLIIAQHDQLTLAGYTFQNWNTAKDGSGMTYLEGQQLVMPEHDLTLYAIWKKIPTDTSTTKKGSPVSLFQVKTSDDTPIVVCSLLCLSALGGMIVMKVLKKKDR